MPFAYLPTFNLSHILSVHYDFLPNASRFLQLEQPLQRAPSGSESVPRWRRVRCECSHRATMIWQELQQTDR